MNDNGNDKTNKGYKTGIDTISSDKKLGRTPAGDVYRLHPTNKPKTMDSNRHVKDDKTGEDANISIPIKDAPKSTNTLPSSQRNDLSDQEREAGRVAESIRIQSAGSRYNLIEHVRNSYKNRGVVDTFTSVGNKVNHQPAWRSYFSFDNDLPPFLQRHKALNKEYQGNFSLPEIIFDLDSDKSNLNLALEETRKLVQYLLRYHQIPGNHIRVFFSGQKGFHIHMPDHFEFKPSNQLPINLKATLFDEFNFLTTLDLSMITASGLIRIPYSKHGESNLYKVEIPYAKIFSITVEEVLVLAANPCVIPYSDPEIFDHLLSRLKRVPKVKVSSVVRKDTEYGRRVICMQTLYNRGPVAGTRHDEILRLASWLMRSGVPEEGAKDLITGWLGSLALAKDDGRATAVVHDVYNRGFTYGCSDSVMSSLCDTKCIFYRRKSYGESDGIVRSPSQLLGALRIYQERVEKGDAINLRSFWPVLDDDYLLMPGDCGIVTGDTGMGKSALVQNIIINQFPHHGKRVLYLNLEMDEAKAYRRFMQIAHGGLTKGEVSRMLNRLSEEAILAPLSHVDMVSVSPKYTEIATEVRNRKPDMLVIDTIDEIDVPEARDNDTARLRIAISELRSIAQKEKIIVLAVHHITKRASIDGVIDLNSLTGNRGNVTKMDHVFSFTGKRNDPSRIFKTLKQRDDEPLTINMVFDGTTMTVRPYSPGIPLFDNKE